MPIAVQSLYAVSYGAKFAVRKAGGPDFRVSPLEGLWWADDPDAFLLHIGPYAAEAPTIARLHEFIRQPYAGGPR